MQTTYQLCRHNAQTGGYDVALTMTMSLEQAEALEQFLSSIPSTEYFYRHIITMPGKPALTFHNSLIDVVSMMKVMPPAKPSGIQCYYCAKDPGTKNGVVWNGFLDKDNNRYVCNHCRNAHYMVKSTTEHQGLYSEFPVTINPQP